MVLVAHKSKLFALPRGSGEPVWQFPAANRDAYHVSDAARDSLTSALADLNLSSGDESNVRNAIDDLTVSGPSVKSLKDTVNAASADADGRSRFSAAVDHVTKLDKDALSNLQALYGDIGLSTDGRTAFVPAFKGIVFALDTSDGHMRWWRDAGDELVGGVAVEGDTLYYGSKGRRLFAVSADDGSVRWTYHTRGEVWATPTVAGDGVYLTSLDGSVYRLDRSGSEQWVFTGAGSGIASRPTVAGGGVYVGSFDNKLYGINAADGSLKWSLGGDNWFWAAPVEHEGTVYAANLDGRVYAVAASDGSQRWVHPFDAGAPIRSGPVVAGDGLMVAARNGDVYKLDLGSGEPQGSPVVAGTTVYANLTADDASMVYVVPTSATLYVINAARNLETSVYSLP